MANEYSYRRVDNKYDLSIALSNGAGTVYTADIDMGTDAFKGRNLEVEVTIPTLNTTQLPDTETMTANLYGGAAATPTTILLGSVGVLTGAGGAGAAGVTKRTRLPSDCPRYIRVGFVKTGTGDCSSLNGLAKLKF